MLELIVFSSTTVPPTIGSTTMRVFSWMLLAVVSLGMCLPHCVNGQGIGGLIDRGRQAVGGASDGLSDAEKQLRRKAEDTARAAREARDRIAKEAARIDELRREAEKVIREFERMKKHAETIQHNIKEAKRLGNMDQRQIRREAYSQLRSMGVLGSNRTQVLRQLNSGLTIFVAGAEFDHADQIQLAGSVAASVATGNPGPLALQIKQFLLETKQQFMKNLRNVGSQARARLEREFERLMLQALNDIFHGRTPRPLQIEGVTVEVNLATFNNWVDVRWKLPELKPTQKVLGVQLYTIGMHDRHDRVPLPNTFLPYVRMQVHVSR